MTRVKESIRAWLTALAVGCMFIYYPERVRQQAIREKPILAKKERNGKTSACKLTPYPYRNQKREKATLHYDSECRVRGVGTAV